MPRQRINAVVEDPASGRTAEPFVIDPNAVYLPGQVRAALGLRASSLRSEWRAGRLRIVRRCGRNFLLGKDLIAWLDSGELKRSRPTPEMKMPLG